MKVYLVLECFPYEGCAPLEPECIFATRELAEQAIEAADRVPHWGDAEIRECEVVGLTSRAGGPER